MAMSWGWFRTDECRPPAPALLRQRGDRFVAHAGFDPRALATPRRWLPFSPCRTQAWREVNERADRQLVRDARWLA